MLIDFTGDQRSLRPDLHGAARDPDHLPFGAAEDWTVPQQWERFTAEEHAVWDHLFDRQQRALQENAVEAFRDGLTVLRLSKPGIPDFEELNERLIERTGWRVVAVPGLVPDSVFFDHLRHRRFPAGNFIRRRTQLDYIEEPDVFHDVFGHVPILADAIMAEWVQRLGDFAAEAEAGGTLPLIARLYWRTVEFGLAQEQGHLRILGAGILSSFGESRYALESSVPARRPLDFREVLAIPYRSDSFQDLYFVVEDLGDLVRMTERSRWNDLVEEFAR